MKSKLILIALMVVVAMTGSQAQSGQTQDRRPTPTSGGTDATSSHVKSTGSTTNKPAMGAGSNNLTVAGSGKKSASGSTSGQEKKGSKTAPRPVNQQAAGVPESGSSTGKRKNR